LAHLETEVLVIGGGPGGYAAAIRLARAGKRVALAERDRLGGVCLNRGCIPAKALIHAANQFHRLKSGKTGQWGIRATEVVLDPAQTVNWKNGITERLQSGIESLLKANRVDRLKGSARLLDANTAEIAPDDGSETVTVSFRHCILATGSKPAELPVLPFDHVRVLSSDDALDLTKVPDRLAIVGGGVIGVELGTVFAKFGSRVTILEAAPQLLPGIDPQAVRPVAAELARCGVRIETGVRVRGAEVRDGGVLITAEKDGESFTVEADCVLVSVGRTPNSGGIGLERAGVATDEKGFIRTDAVLCTTVPHIYAIGDVRGGPFLAHKASYEAKIAAESICGLRTRAEYDLVPYVIFSDPEIAGVGLTEQEAMRKGYRVKTGKFPFQASGRAMTIGETAGFVKLVIDADSHEILGALAVGPEASELIAEAALAIGMGATAEDVEQIIHAHPTLSEAFLEAAEASLGRALHIVNPR